MINFFFIKIYQSIWQIFFSLIVHVFLCIHVSVAMNSVIHFTILMPANFYKVQLFNTEKQTKQKENKAQPHIIKRIYLKFPSYTDTNQAVMTFYHIFIYSFTVLKLLHMMTYICID